MCGARAKTTANTIKIENNSEFTDSQTTNGMPLTNWTRVQFTWCRRQYSNDPVIMWHFCKHFSVVGFFFPLISSTFYTRIYSKQRLLFPTSGYIQSLCFCRCLSITIKKKLRHNHNDSIVGSRLRQHALIPRERVCESEKKEWKQQHQQRQQYKHNQNF